MILIWDPENVSHIAKHGVTKEEASFVVKYAEPPYPREIEDEKFVIWGQTSEGRYLQVLFVFLDDDQIDWEAMDPADKIRYAEGDEEVARVIHGRDLNEREKR